MTAQSTQARIPAAADAAATGAAEPKHGAEIFVPLNLLKPSPKNARKVKHSEATLEGLAASIKAKGVLQPPVVEIERGEDGAPTGAYLVTIGEGRRLALRMLVKRKAIKRNHPVKVTVDTENDAHEISLDENITREAMHPADQFEAFKRLADERGYGPEEIGARFGVSAQTVRQRLRLGAAAPELMSAYREGALALDQLMAFCVSDDQDRQRQVFEQMGQHMPVYAIRRAMTESKVAAGDKRVRFVGVEVYEAEGGTVLCDLFTEDGGGWLDDPALLDRLVSEKLAGLAEDARQREGWKWAEAGSDYQDAAALGRVYPVEVVRSEADAAQIAALSDEYDRLVSETDAAEMFPPPRWTPGWRRSTRPSKPSGRTSTTQPRSRRGQGSWSFWATTVWPGSSADWFGPRMRWKTVAPIPRRRKAGRSPSGKTRRPPYRTPRRTKGWRLCPSGW